jgi:hypothetical protein
VIAQPGVERPGNRSVGFEAYLVEDRFIIVVGAHTCRLAQNARYPSLRARVGPHGLIDW